MATKAATTKKSPAKRAVPAKTKRASVSTPTRAKSVSFVDRVSKTLKQASSWRAFGAELFGTFLLAAAIIVGQGQPIVVMFALVGIVLLVGALSGGHLNPAVTIGALITRRIEWTRAVGYIIAQIIGAVLAFVVLDAFLGGAAASEETNLFFAAPALFQAHDLATVAGKEWYVFFAELTGMAILGYAIANALRSKERLVSAFSAGIGIFIALMVAATATSYVAASAIINPAVAISLQALSWEVWPLVVYVLAPALGGIVGFVLYDVLNGRKA